MAAQQDPYVRVYYSIVDDPKFDTVYDNDGALALWLRLLLVADATYPAPAPIPTGTKSRSLKALVGVGIIDLASGSRFRVHGMKAERDRRAEQARQAARKRWGKDEPDAGSDASAMRTHTGRNAGAPDRASPLEMHSAPLRDTPLRSSPLREDLGRTTPTGFESVRATSGSGRPT